VGLIKNVEDIEHIVLTSQPGGIPVLVKDVARVSVGHLPRLGKAGRDDADDVVTAIVVMNRTLHANEVLARVKDEIAKVNTDGTLPAGPRRRPSMTAAP
jgi:cobalt-zinc-cadmium resistance protein CzcA